MSNRSLLFPDSIPNELKKRFTKQHRAWLSDLHEWPLVIDLGGPTEEDAFRNRDFVQRWITSWRSWSGLPELHWRERRWRDLGTQSLPHKLVFNSPAVVADFIGQGDRWRQAKTRHDLLIKQWPMLASILPKHFEWLADYEDVDFHRLKDLLEWFIANGNSNLYPRQIPMAGIDTKWFEKRSSILSELLVALNPTLADQTDLYARLGLRRPPSLCRIRVLDPSLLLHTGGLSDISAPNFEIDRLTIAPSTVIIIENLQTFLSFDELPGTVLVLGMGYSVTQMCSYPWQRNARCLYWGDIDTHGFAILNQARARLPGIKSLLMDEHTLLENRTLWSKEDYPTNQELPQLDDSERNVYSGLRAQRWGTNVRLEQERISWTDAWTSITGAALSQSHALKVVKLL
jgi:hypothetical protein